MDFEHDLFISYAHIDDLPFAKGKQGWVSRFHDTLEAMLSGRLGKPARIWRDARKLASNDVFAAKILDQFEKTAVMLSVVSPRYIESDWCRREALEFCKAAEQALALTIEDKSRIMKILKLPVDSDDALPPMLHETMGIQFYNLTESNTPLEFDPAYGLEMEERYNKTVAMLAWQISVLLKLMKNYKPSSGGVMPPGSAVLPAMNGAPPAGAADTVAPAVVEVTATKRPTVYLAQCSLDKRDAWQALDIELRSHGFTVLPNSDMPRDEAGYVEEVGKLLAQSQLAIHIVGSAYGSVPDGMSGKSIVVLQNELAIEASHKTGLPRIIWLPEGTESQHREQKQFLFDLQTLPEAQFGADLITSTQQEVFKGAITEALKKIEEAKPAKAEEPEEAAGHVIYVICDVRDLRPTREFRKMLSAKGYEVEVPLFEGDAAAMRRANDDSLARCSGVLIYYGEGGEAWKRSTIGEIRKFMGCRTGKQKVPVYTCVAGPETEAKLDLVDSGQRDVINGLDGVTEGGVQPFLRALEGGGQ